MHTCVVRGLFHTSPEVCSGPWKFIPQIYGWIFKDATSPPHNYLHLPSLPTWRNNYPYLKTWCWSPRTKWKNLRWSGFELRSFQRDRRWRGQASVSQWAVLVAGWSYRSQRWASSHGHSPGGTYGKWRRHLWGERNGETRCSIICTSKDCWETASMKTFPRIPLLFLLQRISSSSICPSLNFS